ncbi:transposase [Chitinispirillum alkaliphilum]|nr:transposase [Chitinispirillum alkaliphilum]
MDAKDNPLSTPHDTLFRETFSRIETVRSFVANYVPKKISSQLNLQTLAIQKDSFIDKELSEHFSDILYSVKLRGKPAFLYLLFEHKSYIDPWTGFQLLRNMVKIWEQYRKQHKRTDTDLPGSTAVESRNFNHPSFRKCRKYTGLYPRIQDRGI